MADNWLHVAPSSGGSGTTNVNITADTNSTNSQRTAIIYFKAGKIKKTVRVVQGAASSIFTVVITSSNGTILNSSTTSTTLTASAQGTTSGALTYTWKTNEIPAGIIATVNGNTCLLTYTGDTEATFEVRCTINDSSSSADGTIPMSVQRKTPTQTVQFTPNANRNGWAWDEYGSASAINISISSATPGMTILASVSSNAFTISPSSVNIGSGGVLQNAFVIYPNSQNTSTTDASCTVTLSGSKTGYNPTSHTVTLTHSAETNITFDAYATSTLWNWDQSGSTNSLPIGIRSGFTQGITVTVQLSDSSNFAVSPSSPITPSGSGPIESAFRIYPTSVNNTLINRGCTVTLTATKGAMSKSVTIVFTQQYRQEYNLQLSATTTAITYNFTGTVPVYAKCDANGFTYNSHTFNNLSPATSTWIPTFTGNSNVISTSQWTEIGLFEPGSNEMSYASRSIDLDIRAASGVNTCDSSIHFSQDGNPNYDPFSVTYLTSPSSWQWDEVGSAYEKEIEGQTAPQGKMDNAVLTLTPSGTFSYTRGGFEPHPGYQAVAKVYPVTIDVALEEVGEEGERIEVNKTASFNAKGQYMDPEDTGVTITLTQVKPTYALTYENGFNTWPSGDTHWHKVSGNTAAIAGGMRYTPETGFNDYFTLQTTVQTQSNYMRIKPTKGYYGTVPVEKNITIWCDEISGGTYDTQQDPPVRTSATQECVSAHTLTLDTMRSVWLVFKASNNTTEPGTVGAFYTSYSGTTIKNGDTETTPSSTYIINTPLIAKTEIDTPINDLYVKMKFESVPYYDNVSGVVHFSSSELVPSVDGWYSAEDSSSLYYKKSGQVSWEPIVPLGETTMMPSLVTSIQYFSDSGCTQEISPKIKVAGLGIVGSASTPSYSHNFDQFEDYTYTSNAVVTSWINPAPGYVSLIYTSNTDCVVRYYSAVSQTASYTLSATTTQGNITVGTMRLNSTARVIAYENPVVYPVNYYGFDTLTSQTFVIITTESSAPTYEWTNRGLSSYVTTTSTSSTKDGFYVHNYTISYNTSVPTEQTTIVYCTFGLDLQADINLTFKKIT